MAVAFFATVFLLASPTPPEAPPPRVKASYTITLGCDTVLYVPDRTEFNYRRVQTPEGPRIRINANGLTFDVSRIRVTGLADGSSMEIRIGLDGMMHQDVYSEPRPSTADPLPPAADPLPPAAPKPMKP